MQATMMSLNVRAPVALGAVQMRGARPAPRLMAINGLGTQLSRASGKSLRSMTAARLSMPANRRHSLIVEATKKSVGDLSKADLEGKRVLVSSKTEHL